nr:putative integron gene cassette protein [uncultured bacterium]
MERIVSLAGHPVGRFSGASDRGSGRYRRHHDHPERAAQRADHLHPRTIVRGASTDGRDPASLWPNA